MAPKYLTESQVHDIEDALKTALEAFGITNIDLDSQANTSGKPDTRCTLSNLLKANGVTIKQSVPFDSLMEEQWQAWYDLARNIQNLNGFKQEDISCKDTDKEAEQLYYQHDGNVQVAEEHARGGSLKIECDIPEDEQASSFQNATLQGARKFAVSIATYMPKSCPTSEEDIKDLLEKELKPMVTRGFSFEVQIGLGDVN